MGRLSPKSQFLENAQQPETHSDSTVVGDILRTDYETVSHTMVLPSRDADDMAVTQPSANTAPIVSKSEEWTVDRLMRSSDVSDSCNQMYGASSTQCRLNGF